MKTLPYISIDYDEGEPSTYRAVELRLGERRLRFASGDVDLDFACALVTAARSNAQGYLTASSVDHFVMDGGALNKSEARIYALVDDPRLTAAVLAAEDDLT